MSDFPVIFHRSLHFPVIFKWAKVQHTESKMMFSQSEQSWKNVMQKQSFAKVLQNGVLKISQTLQDDTCVGVFFKKDCRVEALQHFRKKTLTQMFSCEACKIFENIFFTEHFRCLHLLITSLTPDSLPWVNRRFHLNASLF